MRDFQPEPQQFEIAGVAVSCTICAHDRFWQRRAQLNTPLATMFGLDWANRSATCLVCDNCGYILWFLPE
jgi:hypothetical protein